MRAQILAGVIWGGAKVQIQNVPTKFTQQVEQTGLQDKTIQVRTRSVDRVIAQPEFLLVIAWESCVSEAEFEMFSF